MIVAQKWYCIAQTTSIGSSSGIKVEFGNYYRLLLNASVDWGNAVISIQFSNISKDIVASVRLRNNGQYFYLDIKLSKPFDTDFSTSLYDNSSWNLASSVSDLSGVPICIIDDINSLNTSQTGGESYFVEDENGDLHPIPKEDGTARGIYTDSFISSGGKNPNTEGGGGGFTEFIIKFDDVEVNPEGYKSVDGVVTLPNYPSLDGYLLKDTADNLYQAKGDYATKEELNTLDKYIKSLFTAEYDENDVLISIKASAGLWTNQYLSSGGKNANAGGEGGGVTSFDIMFEGDNVSRYPLENGVVILPAYPTVPDVSGFILKDTADSLYQPKGNYLTSIPSEYITETELSDALFPYLLSQTAADTYATIDALNTHIADYTAFKTNTNKRLQSLEDMFEWDDDGHIKAKAGLYTDSFLSSGGKNTTEGTTGGGLTEFSVIFNGTQYDSSNGVATIDGTYATSDAVNDAIATSKSYTDTSIANLINGAPSTLDTLKEIADAMDANQDVVDALEEAIGTKASQSALDTLSGRVTTAESDISTNKNAIGTLQGYFTNGIAKEAAKVSNIFKIIFNGTTYEYNGGAAKEINFSATNIVSALGTTPVNRAKGDESGNNIKTTYATKTALQEFIDKIEKYFTFGEDNIKANYGLWTDSYLSSGGQNTEGGSGGGGLTSFSVVINNKTYNSDNGVATITEQLQPLITASNKLDYSLISGTPTSLPASDVYAWAKSPTKPTYTKSEVGLGNVDNTSDSSKIVKAVIDYNDAARTVYIGYAGTGLTATNATHLAAYSVLSDGRQVIKDMSKDNVKTWLGLGDLAYLSSISWNKITSDKPTTLAGYGITDKVAYRETWNNLMHSTNEFTFAAPAYSSYIWMNFRTASGSFDGAITEYRFAKGAGLSYADIRAAKYIVNGGTSSQFLKADGGLDSTAYLPLSGGIMANNAGISWTYNVHSWDAPVDGFECISTTNDTLGYYSGLSYKGYYGLQIRAYGDNTDDIKVRGYNSRAWGTWRALIHSGNIKDYNAGSATKLQTARTIWGQSFDGTQNLYGAIFMGATEDTLYNVMQVTSNLNLTIGLDTAKAGKTTLISGNKITFRYGTTPTVGMQINNTGNVTIGASDLASTAVKLYVDGSATINGILSASGSINLRPGTNLYGSLVMDTNRMSIQALHDGVAYLPISLNSSGGNVLIGTTTDNGAKLQVNGSIRPSTTASYALGNTSYTWTDVWCRNIINNTTDGFFIGSRSGVGATDGGALIYSYGNAPISFYTKGTERMCITGSGNVNIYGPSSIIMSSGSVDAIYYATRTDLGFNIGIGIGTSNNRGIYDTKLGWLLKIDTSNNLSLVGHTVNGNISASGNLTVNGSASLAAENKHYIRTGNTTYTSGWYYGTAGNEAMAFINNAAISSFMFVQGKTAIENWGASTWQSVTPALQIKQNCVAINYLWGQNVTPDYTLRVEGSAYFSDNIYASGAITAGTASDKRLKDNICTINQNQAIEVLMALNPITFIWAKKATELGGFEGISQGFIAQEYESIIPNSGRVIWGEYRAIDYTKAIPFMVSVEQNHEQRIRQLEEENKELKQELETIKKQYNYGIY